MTVVSLDLDLSVVVVSHNHAAFLDKCLTSLAPERHSVASEVLVVDNVSEDNTLEVARCYPWVRLIVNHRRQGFAANNNQAIRQSRGRYVMLLNPDTEVEPGALATLVAFMDAHPLVGICGPQLRFPDGSFQASCRRFPTLASVIVRRTPLRRWLQQSLINAHHLMVELDHSQPQYVDWLLGACLCVPRRFLQTVGLLDPGFFLYVEDIDWARRAWQEGWQVMYCPHVVIIHHHLAVSDKRLLSRNTWWHTQSMWRYYRKHMAPKWLRLSVAPEILP